MSAGEFFKRDLGVLNDGQMQQSQVHVSEEHQHNETQSQQQVEDELTAELPEPCLEESEEDLADWIDPEVPGPQMEEGDMEGDEDGFMAIDRVGGWAAHLAPFPTLEEIPFQCQHI